ncbi:MAG: hypothetical protein E5W94_11045 [Mesorhizobium sp.]|nr:MAG: hypothetical protein E5W94_11045 [Mesorhizobium sp.]
MQHSTFQKHGQLGAFGSVKPLPGRAGIVERLGSPRDPRSLIERAHVGFYLVAVSDVQDACVIHDHVLVDLEARAELVERDRLAKHRGEQLVIVCSALPGPSRAERRRQYQSSHPAPPRNLGVIEGERLQRSRGYHEDYSLAKNLASLAAVTAILFCAAVVMGAL